MMRHSKSQTHVRDGSKLTALKPNCVQWQALPFPMDSSGYVYKYIECLLVKQLRKTFGQRSGTLREFEHQLQGAAASSNERKLFMKFKQMLVMLQRCATHAALCDLKVLDLFIRSVERQQPAAAVTTAAGIPRFLGEQVLTWLRQAGANAQSGGLNYQTDRAYALEETKAQREARERYEAMSVHALRSLVAERDLCDSQHEKHEKCRRAFVGIAAGKLAERKGVPRAEIQLQAEDEQRGLGPCVGMAVGAQWTQDLTLHAARVTAEHPETCVLSYMVSDLACKIIREGGESLVMGGSSLVILEGKACNPL